MERGTAFQLFNTDDGATAVSEVPAADGAVAFTLKASRRGDIVTFTGAGDAQNWSVCLRNVQKVRGVKGGSHAGSEWGVVVKAEGMRWRFSSEVENARWRCAYRAYGNYAV